MTVPRILIDAGNTRLKWVVVAGGRWLTQGQTGYADLSGLSAVMTAEMRAWVASVTREENAAKLRALLEQTGIPAHWIEVGQRFGDVENGYALPAQLGVDRWMALMGARQRTQAPALVVSAGTAMTVDAMTETGRFVGGIIVPGMTLMRTALERGTAQVSVGNGVWCDFPRCTADAVESGIIAAQVGAIQSQYARLAALSVAPPRCLLTGGDAERLLPYLDMGAERVPALVLEGIDCVARKGDLA